MVLFEGVGLSLYRWQPRRQRFGAAAHVPESVNVYWEQLVAAPVSEYPHAAVNDHGAVAIAWREGQDHGLGRDECICAVRAVVLGANGSFGPVQEIARPTSPHKEVVGLQLSRPGEARVLWRQINNEKLAPISGRQHPDQLRVDPTKAPNPGLTDDGVLTEEDGHPALIYPDPFEEAPTRVVYLTRSPFHTSTSIGTVPAGPADTQVIVSDRRGDYLALVANGDLGGVLQAAYRRHGGSFGAVQTVLPLGAPVAEPNCTLDATEATAGEVLVAWACDSELMEMGGTSSFVQAALLSRDGSSEKRVRASSSPRRSSRARSCS